MDFYIGTRIRSPGFQGDLSFFHQDSAWELSRGALIGSTGGNFGISSILSSKIGASRRGHRHTVLWIRFFPPGCRLRLAALLSPAFRRFRGPLALSHRPVQARRLVQLL